jgi:pimeloyl-ACP methyl ester carboxylesterase
LFDNAGVAGSSGETPGTMEAMADNAADFIDALGISTADVLGHSIGGYIAQTLALRHPKSVRRLILAGTGPRAGEPSKDPKVRDWADSTDPETGESSLDAFLYLFFRPSPTSQVAGKAFWERRYSGERFADLKRIPQPTLVLNGVHDEMIPVSNSYSLSGNLPNAVLMTYPDSGHGALFQFHQSFTRQVGAFLSADSMQAPY